MSHIEINAGGRHIVVDHNGQPDQLHWDHADPETHVSVDLLKELDDRGRAFLEARYELGEPCPYPDQPNTVHARLRPPEETTR